MKSMIVYQQSEIF